MKAFVVLLDTRPAFLKEAHGPTSLLLTPLGPATVLRHLARRLASVGHATHTIATDFEPDPAYARRIRECGTRIHAIVGARDLAGGLADWEPSDWLVIVDPRCVPSAGLTRGALDLEMDGGPRRARHLVALEVHSGGTTECVQLGANGTVGRIQRYYDSATWPFTSGVACSAIPVASILGASDLSFTSLRDLRRGLAERGIPGTDVFIRGGAFDLSQERHLLALSEQLVLDHFAGRRAASRRWLEAGIGCRVDPSARLVGPVILQAGAVIGPRATVVGPAVIGRRARVEGDAVVAQCVLAPDSVVGEGLTLCHRVICGPVSDASESTVLLDEPACAPAVEPTDVHDRRERAAGAYPFLKAAFDVTASALGLLLLAPLLLLIAIVVKLESAGPAFYRDRREGRGGRIFDCLKFRTMCAGAEGQQRELLARNQNEVDGPQFKLANDPRVTRVGGVLRRLNLDEVPQLFNVLSLQMSLVGPRPSPFRENQLCIPWRDARLSVRPGITGLWQVCRNRGLEADFDQWIHFDLLYVRNQSFVTDVKILAATVLTLGGQWTVPAAWILPRPRRAAAPETPDASSTLSTYAGGGTPSGDAEVMRVPAS